MEHIVRFEMSDEVIKATMRRMAVEYLKGGAPLGLIVWLAAAIVLTEISAPPFLLGMWFGILALIVTWCVYLHFHRVNRMRAYHEKFGSRQTTLILLPEGIRVNHELGTTLLSWRIYNHLVRHRDIWFLHWSPYDFIIMPATAFSAEASAFMEQQILSAGGKVTGKVYASRATTA